MKKNLRSFLTMLLVLTMLVCAIVPVAVHAASSEPDNEPTVENSYDIEWLKLEKLSHVDGTTELVLTVTPDIDALSEDIHNLSKDRVAELVKKVLSGAKDVVYDSVKSKLQGDQIKKYIADYEKWLLGDETVTLPAVVLELANKQVKGYVDSAVAKITADPEKYLAGGYVDDSAVVQLIVNYVKPMVDEDPTIDLASLELGIADFKEILADNSALVEDAKQEVMGKVNVDSLIGDISAKEVAVQFLLAIDSVTIDGEALYDRDAEYSINPDVIKNLLLDLPKPYEIANMDDDEMKLSYDVAVNTDFGNVAFTLTAKIGGGYDEIRAIAGFIADHVDVSYVNGVLDVDLYVPDEFAALLRKAANSDKISRELKEKVFNAFNANGNDVYALLNNLTVEDIKTLVNAIDFEGMLTSETLSKYVDLSKYSDVDPEALIDKYERYFNLAIKYVNVVADKAANVIPEKYMDNSFISIFEYEDSNDSFSYNEGAFNYAGTHTLPTADYFWKAVNALSERYPEYKSDIDTLIALIDPDYIRNYTASVDVTVNVADVRRVDFYGVNGEFIKSGFLPVGADLDLFADYGEEYECWFDELGVPHDVMPDRDVVLTASITGDIHYIDVSGIRLENNVVDIESDYVLSVDLSTLPEYVKIESLTYDENVTKLGRQTATLVLSSTHPDYKLVNNTIELEWYAKKYINLSDDTSFYWELPTDDDGNVGVAHVYEEGTIHTIKLVIPEEYKNILTIKTDASGTDAGRYVAKVTEISINKGYEDCYAIKGEIASAPWTITPRSIDIKAEDWTTGNFLYDGKEHGIKIDGISEYTFIYAAGSNSASDAGDYVAKVIGIAKDGKLDKNYAVTGVTSMPWSIEKGNAIISGFGIDGWTYGQPANAPYGVTNFGEIIFLYSDAPDGEYTVTVPSKVGIYYVKAVVEGTENYNGAETAPVAFLIKYDPEWMDIDLIKHTDAPMEILVTLYPEIDALVEDLKKLDRETLVTLIKPVLTYAKDVVFESLKDKVTGEQIEKLVADYESWLLGDDVVIDETVLAYANSQVMAYVQSLDVNSNSAVAQIIAAYCKANGVTPTELTVENLRTILAGADASLVDEAKAEIKNALDVNSLISGLDTEALVLKLLASIDNITINGNVIYENVDGPSLKLDAIKNLILELPRPYDIANMSDDEMQLSYDVAVNTAYGNVALTLTGKVGGGFDEIRKIASIIANNIDIKVGADGTIDVDLRIPDEFAAILLRAAKSDMFSTNIKQKIFAAFDKADGNAIYELYSSLTVNDIVEILETIDFERIIDREFIKKYVDVSASDDKIDALVEKYKGYIAIVKNYADVAVDFLVARIPEKYMDNSFMSILGYSDSNDSFTYSEGKFNYTGAHTLPVTEYFYKLINKLNSKYPEYQKYTDLLVTLVEDYIRDYSVSLDVTVDVEDIRRVDFYDLDGNYISSGFLPVGADLDLFANYDATIYGWFDENGNRYTVMPDHDVVLRAMVIESIKWPDDVEIEYSSKTPDLNVDVEYKGDVTVKWYDANGNEVTDLAVISKLNARDEAYVYTAKVYIGNELYSSHDVKVKVVPFVIDLSDVSLKFEKGEGVLALGAPIEFVNLPEGVTYTLAFSKNTVNYSSIDSVGTWTVTATFALTEGFNNGNYTLSKTELEATVKVNKYIDMSKVEWSDNNSKTYDKTSVTLSELLLNLPDGVTATFEVKLNDDVVTEIKNAGTYEITVTFKTDNDEWYVLENVSEELEHPFTYTVKKAQINVSNLNWNYTDPFTYNPNASYTVELERLNDLYVGLTAVYEGNSGATVGSYVASVVSFEGYDDANYEIVGSVEDCAWEIVKYKIDPTGIQLPGLNVDYDGTVYRPNVTFTNEAERALFNISYNISEISYPGTYTVKATLTLKDSENYEIDGVVGIVIIRTADFVINYEFQKDFNDVHPGFKVEVSEGDGFGPDFGMTGSDCTVNVKDSYEYDGKTLEVLVAYDISFTQNGQKITISESDGKTFKVSLLIPEDYRGLDDDELMVIHIKDDGTIEVMNAVREGDYMVFETNHFSVYAIVRVEGPSLAWLWILLILVAIALIAVVVFLFIRRRKAELNAPAPDQIPAVTADAETPADETPVEEVPTEEVVTEDTEEEVPVVDENSANEEEIPVVAVEEEPVVEEPTVVETPKTAVLVMGEDGKDATAVIGGETVHIRFRSSFMSRLIQADERVQMHYTILKNHILSYKGIKARGSWNYEAFNKGRLQCVKLNIKGKTLIVNLNLDPAEYNINKYHFLDMSAKPKFAKVPMMMKVRSDRALKYTVELIDEMMKKLEIPQREIPDVDYRMPYETTEELAKRGLVKVILPAGVTLSDDMTFVHMNVSELIESGTSTKTTEQIISTDMPATNDEAPVVVEETPATETPAAVEETPVEVAPAPVEEEVHVDAVTADQLITDEEAEAKIEVVHVAASARSGKMGEINLDIICENFEDGERVDIDSLKAKHLISNKIGKVKVLARGVMTKKLTIAASKFSLQAVKMITLAGGKAEIEG